MHLKSSQSNACSALLNHDCCFYAFLFVSGGELYSGTVADFSGSDALIIRDHLRTDRLELKHLNGKNYYGNAFIGGPES